MAVSAFGQVSSLAKYSSFHSLSFYCIILRSKANHVLAEALDMICCVAGLIHHHSLDTYSYLIMLMNLRMRAAAEGLLAPDP